MDSSDGSPECSSDKDDRLRLAFISHVYPFPPTSGQSQRVRYMLSALRERFHVTFLGVVVPGRRDDTEAQLRMHVDDVVLLDSRYASEATRWLLWPVQFAYQAATGLKASNFQIGCIELSPHRVSRLLGTNTFDIGVLQYWHAWRGAQVLRDRGVPIVLDMHNILWQSLAVGRRGSGLIAIPDRLPRVAAYRRREERAWSEFEAVMAINEAERAHVSRRWPGIDIETIAMGADLERWPYRWSANGSVGRVAFYAGLSGERGVQDALLVYREVMPEIWAQRPDTQLVIIGADPPSQLRELASERVTVTGFVPDPGVHLGAVRALICPFVGRYGFRSRVIEAMASGTPIVCTPDAVYGMNLNATDGLSFAENPIGLARSALALLADDDMAEIASMRSRATVEARYGLEATYGRAPAWLEQVADHRPDHRGPA